MTQHLKLSIVAVGSELTVLSLETILEKISEITLQIQQGRDLEGILQWTVDDIRTLLQTDRVLICRFLANEAAVMTVESVGAEWIPVIGQSIDQALHQLWAEPHQGKIIAISDIYREEMPVSQLERLEHWQVQANLVIPILHQAHPWGLLMVHHCHSPREWQPLEMQYLQQIALHLSVAIQQSALRQSYQDALTELEQWHDRSDSLDRQQTEATLQEREYYYAQILNSVQEMVFCKAPGSIVTYANQAACTYYGMTLEQLRGVTDVPFNQLDFTQQYLQDDLHVFTTGEVVNRLEEPNQGPNGEVRYFHTIKSPIFDADGNIRQIVGVSRDITEYQQAEAQLRRYERIVSATPDCVSLVDRNYVYQVVNQTYLTWTQKSYDQIIGHSVIDVLGQEFFASFVQPKLDRCLAGEPLQHLEGWRNYADGRRRYFRAIYTPYIELDGTIAGVVSNIHDLTDLKETEEALRKSELRLREQQQFTEQIAESTLAILYVYDLIEQRNIYCNQQIETILGYSPAEIRAMGDALFPLLIHPDDLPKVMENQQELVRMQGDEFVEIEYRMRHKAGDYRWLLSRGKVLNCTPEGYPKQIIGVGIDITAVKEAQAALYQQTERERLLMAIAHNIRQTLDLEQILHTAVMEVRQLLQVDRVVIYRFEADWSGMIIAESVAEGWNSILGMHITDTYFATTQGQRYLEGYVTATDDIYTAGLDSCCIKRLEQLQVRAQLVVPILQNDCLWGLLVAHHCQNSRYWDPFEIALHQQLTTQIAIALQQSALYQRVQTLNTELELQVQERTAQLQQVLDFEALLKRITDRVRDSLDESQILQTAVQELVVELNIECCDAALYDLEHRTSTISYESIRSGVTPAKGLVFSMNSSYGIHDQLLQGQSMQFCLTPLWSNNYRSTIDHRTAILSCPFQDEQGVIGDLWLFKPQQEYFSDPEVRLVQQVANQCAIALRQSRLYQVAQAQVQELERLSRLKDDFLSTVSHELRSPMSNIKMATQMLEITLNRLGILADTSSPVNRYFHILREEGQREINLINDLLDLTRLDIGTDSLEWTDVDLQVCIPHLAEMFMERMRQQQQQFLLQIPATLPPFLTHQPYLERILTELLHNACKYTPAGETITISAQATAAAMEICVSNSGVEIAPEELLRIFDKFYRIPRNDPWKYGGTGLGLSLVKKLVECMGGEIKAESTNHQTCFQIKLTTQSAIQC